MASYKSHGQSKPGRGTWAPPLLSPVGAPQPRAKLNRVQRQLRGQTHGQHLQGARQGNALILLPFACLAQQRRMIFAISILPITESLHNLV